MKLIFRILKPNGIMKTALTYNGTDRQITTVLNTFYTARARVKKLYCSSQHLFGGGFEVGSMHWLASFTVNVIAVNDDDEIFVDEIYEAPYLEKILQTVE